MVPARSGVLSAPKSRRLGGGPLAVPPQAAWLEHRGVEDAGEAELAASLEAMREHFPGFVSEARTLGWNTDEVIIRTPAVYIKYRERGAAGEAAGAAPGK